MEHCHMCQRSKGGSTNARLYTLLPTNKAAWPDVSMDFFLNWPT